MAGGAVTSPGGTSGEVGNVNPQLSEGKNIGGPGDNNINIDNSVNININQEQNMSTMDIISLRSSSCNGLSSAQSVSPMGEAQGMEGMEEMMKKLLEMMMLMMIMEMMKEMMG